MSKTVPVIPALILGVASFALSASLAFAAPLSDPSTLQAVAVSSSQINLNWTDNSSKETGFQVLRSTDGVNYTLIETTGANVTSYSSGGLNSNITYYYKVRAYRGNSYSGYSNTASATTFDTVPAAPTNMNTWIGTTSPAVNLYWTDNSSNEDGFVVERGTDGVNFAFLATTSSNIYWYQDTSVSSGTYYYRAHATNAVGDSAYSNVAEAQVP